MTVMRGKATSNADFETPPAGNLPAVLVGIIDLGTHEHPGFQGGPPETKRTVLLVWELVEELKADSKMRHTIGRSYTLSFAKKAGLRILLEKWRGRDYMPGDDIDISKVLGMSCLLSVTHTSKGDNTYARVDGIAPVVKGMTVPAPQNRPLLWEIDSGQPIPEADWIPYVFGESVKDLVERSDEWKARNRPATNGTPQHQTRPAEEAMATAAEEESVPANCPF